MIDKNTEIRQYEEWTELRDVNEDTRTYDDQPNFRDSTRFRNARCFLSWKRNPGYYYQKLVLTFLIMINAITRERKRERERQLNKYVIMKFGYREGDSEI